MAIPTHTSLHGFIVTTPQLTFTGNGMARFYARIGVEHFRKDTDGAYTRLESSFHDMVMYKATAERAYARFRVGDQFVASGYIREFEVDRDGQTVACEEFVARRIGHDTARTRYQVDRHEVDSPAPDPPEPAVANSPQPAVGI
jgi:single-strand DNA-binding protein